MASEPIIDARAIEKSYPQPDGTRIQVVGLTDFAIEPGKIVANVEAPLEARGVAAVERRKRADLLLLRL